MSGSIAIVKTAASAGGQVGRLRRERSAERWEGKNSFSRNQLYTTDASRHDINDRILLTDTPAVSV